MNREQKTAVIDEIADQIKSADAIFAVDYRGISVSQAADLRGRLNEANAKFRVVKNSLSERAADQAGLSDLKPMLIGPTALTLVSGDAAVAAKALNDAARAMNLLEFKGGLLDGAVLTADDVRSIARLPSRDVLNAQLVGTVAAPLTGLARGLKALIAGIAIQLGQIAEQGLVSGSAPEAEAAPAPAPEPEAEAAAEPEAEAAPEPEAEAEPAADPEAEATPEPEAEAAAEPEAEPAAEATPEPEAEAAAEPQAEAAAEPEAEAAPEPEAEAAPEPDPAPEAEATPDEPKESETEAASDAEPSDEKEEA
jgi:large subunit ribosomal protein L10